MARAMMATAVVVVTALVVKARVAVESNHRPVQAEVEAADLAAAKLVMEEVRVVTQGGAVRAAAAELVAVWGAKELAGKSHQEERAEEAVGVPAMVGMAQAGSVMVGEEGSAPGLADSLEAVTA